MNLLHELPPGPEIPNVIYVVVEVPKGSRNKYEYDKHQGFVKLDRVLYSPIHYPGDYGLIPRTRRWLRGVSQTSQTEVDCHGRRAH